MVFVLKVKFGRECNIHLFKYLHDAEKEKAFLNRRGIESTIEKQEIIISEYGTEKAIEKMINQLEYQ